MNIARPAAFSSNDAAVSAAAVPGQSNAPGAAAGAVPAGFIAELANDPLGVVASYLSQPDQLVMRQAGDAVRRVVDATVHRLTLTGPQACDLLAQPDAFRQLPELRLTNCNDDMLVALAEVLGTGARPAFALVLDREDGVEVGAAGCRAIAPLHLSGITLRGLAMPLEVAMVLAESRAPVSISLPFISDGGANLYWITQVPTLTSLSAGMHVLSAACVEALRPHPALTTLSVAALSVDALHRLAGSPRLQYSR
ncbi:MAG: hypothetical protein ACRYGL_19875 [Janthinobacterium lividum]